MLRRMIFTLFVVSACGDDDDRDEACAPFGCAGATAATTTPGSVTGGGDEDGVTGGGGTTGDGAYCTPEDNACVGDDAIQYCDESGDKLHSVACQAVCGMDRESFGCRIDDDDGAAKCFCGPEGGGDGGDPGCDDPMYPVHCDGQHGVPEGCWTVGTDCATVVECPFGLAACESGLAVDCAREVCVPVLPGFESNNALCSNGKDDDGDDNADCADVFCYLNPNVTVCQGESTDFECANGEDDDGDGTTDCGDISCRMSPAVTVCAPEEWRADICDNGKDDDDDGVTDCGDASCYNPFVSVCW